MLSSKRLEVKKGSNSEYMGLRSDQDIRSTRENDIVGLAKLFRQESNQKRLIEERL